MMETAREKALDLLLSGEVNYDLMVAHLILFRPDVLLALQQKENPTLLTLKKLLHFEEFSEVLTHEDAEYYYVMLKSGQKINCIKHYRDRLALVGGIPLWRTGLKELSDLFREADRLVNPAKFAGDADGF